MIKKRTPNKVLRELPGGFSIREVRIIDSKTNKTTSSYITLYQGKKELPGLKFKTVDAAVKYFKEER